MHPTVDRLWHWRRLNGMDDESWPSDAKHTYFHDVYAKDGSVESGGLCYGHGPDDVMSWRNLFDSDDHYYTNRELYTYLAPGSDELPYVYADFAWDHCESEGYSSDLLSKLETARPKDGASDEGDDDAAVQERQQKMKQKEGTSSSDGLEKKRGPEGKTGEMAVVRRSGLS